MKRRSLLGWGFSLLLSPSARAQENAERPGARIARIETDVRPLLVIEGEAVPPTSIPQRMTFYAVPGVSMAFIDDDRVQWTRQYGVADLTTQRVVTAATLFQAGSITKVVTALTALRLVRDGKIQLDEDVNRELTSWKIPENPFTLSEKVTLRRLLSHNAGITVHGFAGYTPDDPLPTIRQILDGVAPANSPAVLVDKVPGSGFRYSGGGYVIVQQLVEDVTRHPFAVTVSRLVLEPAGMSDSTVEQPLPERLKRVAAAGYAADGAPLPGGCAVFPEEAPAGLWTTPTDLARLAIELGREAAGRSARILDQPLAVEMLKRQTDDWGLGVELRDEGQFSHAGSNPGFAAFLIYFSRRRQGVAIMTNGASQSGFVFELAAAIAREYGWPGWKQDVRRTVAVDPAILASYRGTWLSDGAPAFEVLAEQGRLYVQGGPFGPKAVRLYATSPTSFFIVSSGFSFEFNNPEPGKAVLGGNISAVRTSGPAADSP